MTTCVLIRNPVSRRSLDEMRLADAVGIARAVGWDVTVITTEHEGHATEIARDAAARGVEIIVVNGGDGSINEVINGIAGTPTALAVLPGGTANVWAKEAGIQKDYVAAMRDIIDGVRRRVDLGVANDRYFLLMAGVGFDALVVPGISVRMKRRFGAAAYVISGVRAVFRTRSWHVRMVIDAAPIDAPLYWMIIGNTRSYGGFADILYRAEADDGLLDIGIMHRGGPLRVVVDGLRVLLKRHALTTEPTPGSNVAYLQARAIEIQTPGLPVQIDGERAGVTPMRFSIAPLALTVIVPAGLRTPLLRREAEQAV